MKKIKINKIGFYTPWSHGVGKRLRWTNITNFHYHREAYDVRLNQISVSVRFGNHFTVADGILRIKQVNIMLCEITFGEHVL